MRWKICIIALVLSASSSRYAFSVSPIEQPLSRYEQRLAYLTESDKAEERAAAIRALALLASPAYEKCRNHLTQDPDFEVIKALLEAFGYMGDDSLEARLVAVRALKSRSSQLINAVFLNTDFKIRFGDVWQSTKTLPLWSTFAVAFPYEIDFNRFIGVGIVHPWRHPAWKKVPAEVRNSILERAGTREAISIRRGTFVAGNQESYDAEPADLPFLRELLTDSNPFFRQYAASSLGAAGDDEFANLYRSKMNKLLNEPNHPKNNLETVEVDGVSIYSILPLLDDSTLHELVTKDFGLTESGTFQLFSQVNDELITRGSPFRFEELNQQNLPHISGRIINFYRLVALVRERKYDSLAEMIREVRKTDLLSGLRFHIAHSPAFLAGLPPEIAHICYMDLRDDTNEELLRLLGLLARGRDAEDLWQRFRNSGKTTDKRAFLPILWGYNRRSYEIRSILGFSELGTIDFDSSDESYMYLPSGKPCSGIFEFISKFPTEWHGLPVKTKALSAATMDFVQEIQGLYDLTKKTRLLSDFLTARGVSSSTQDITQLITNLKDSRYVIRFSLWKLYRENFPFVRGKWHTTDLDVRYPSEISKFLAFNKTEMVELAEISWSFPAPDLSEKEAQWFQQLLKEERDKSFQGILATFPSTRFGVDQSSNTSALAPSDHFMKHAARYPEEIESLTRDKKVEVRYSAQWAVWNLRFDQNIPHIWMDDSTGSDTVAKKFALFLLQRIRYGPSRSLFPPLLHSVDPAFRQLGILGVHAFQMNEFEEEIIMLTQDPDNVIATEAVAALGTIRSSRAREILVKLLSGQDSNAAAAESSLRNYNTVKDIDSFARILRKSSIDPTTKVKVLSIVNYITHQSQRDPDEKAAAQRWLIWWQENRTRDRQLWIQQGLQNAITKILTRPESSYRSGQYILSLFPWLPAHYSSKESIQELRNWWNIEKHEDTWNLLTASDYRATSNTSLKAIDLLHDIDSNKTLNLLLQRVYGFCNYDEKDLIHKWLLKYSQEDFGDPCLSVCKRDSLITGWMNRAYER